MSGNEIHIEILEEEVRDLTHERDLLASRLCAIAFEAGLYKRRLAEVLDGGPGSSEGFEETMCIVVLAPEEVK